MAKLDPQVLRHLEWIGFVQPSGLVVSAPALVRAGAILDRQDADGQRRLRDCVEERAFRQDGDQDPWLPDFETFARTVLEWSFSPRGYAGTTENPIPEDLIVTAADGETLAPDFAVRERSPGEGESDWQLLVQVLEPGQDFDKEVKGSGALEASPHSRMERLLRRTEVKAGLLFNGPAIRLISAPRGESSGWMDFRVAEMVQTSGQPICTAMRLLLKQSRLLAMPAPQRLAALLEDSRRFQNEVSERLAEQVLHALYEMLRGFQAAHDASHGELLRRTLAENPDRVYHALLTMILRLVFLLYAEERDMLPKDETFQRYYSLVGLYERLREDAALFPDTMDQRYGAWAQLLVLFRLIHDGAETGEMSLPRRHGVLFDPDRFPFLEGRPRHGGAPDSRAHRAAPRTGRHHLPRPGEAAGARRRAALLPGPRRGADRLGLRDHDGVPPGDRERKVLGDQGGQEAGRSHDRGPGGAGCGTGNPARQVVPGPLPTGSSATKIKKVREGGGDGWRTCTRPSRR